MLSYMQENTSISIKLVSERVYKQDISARLKTFFVLYWMNDDTYLSYSDLWSYFTQQR